MSQFGRDQLELGARCAYALHNENLDSLTAGVVIRGRAIIALYFARKRTD